MIRVAHTTAWLSLVGLIGLCVLWETVAAPVRPGGSLLVLKVLPLLVPLFGILREKLYTYRWASMLVLAYFTEGVVRAWADRGVPKGLAVAEIALSVVFFASCLAYVRGRLRVAAGA